MPLNDHPGDYVRRNDKHPQNWPEPPLVEDNSKASPGAQPENILVSSAALRPMLRTGTEFGDIDLVVPRVSGARSCVLTKGHLGLDDYRHLSPSAARGNSSRPYGPRPQAQRIAPQTRVSRAPSAAGYSLHKPSQASLQRAHQGTYDGSYHNSSQDRTSHSAESLRSRLSRGSLRSQRTTFTSATAPSPLLYPKSLQPWIAESYARTRRDQGTQDHREADSPTLGLPLRSTASSSSRPIEIPYGYHNNHILRRLDPVAIGHPAPAYIGRRSVRRTLPQLSRRSQLSERIGNQLSTSLPAEGFFRHGGKPKVPLFYDYTEDFADEEFYTTKGSLSSLPPSIGKESMTDDPPISGEFRMCSILNITRSSPNMAYVLDDDALQSHGSDSDGISSGRDSLKQSQLNHDKINQQRASHADIKSPLPRLPEGGGYAPSNETPSDRHGKIYLGTDQSDDSSSSNSPQKALRNMIPLPLALAKDAHQSTAANAVAGSETGGSHSESVVSSHNLTEGTYGHDARDRLVGFDTTKSIEAVSNSSNQASEARPLDARSQTSFRPRLSTDAPVGPIVETSIYRGGEARINTIDFGTSNVQGEGRDFSNSDLREATLNTDRQKSHEEDSPILLSKASFPWLTADFTPLTMDTSVELLSLSSNSVTPTSLQPSKEEAPPRKNPSFTASTSPWRKLSSPSSIDDGRTGAQQVPKFKLRLHKSEVGKSTSPPELSPSQLNKRYPWTAMSLRRSRDLPKIEIQYTSLDSKQPRFKLRVLRTSSSSAGKFIRFRKSDPTGITQESQPQAGNSSKATGKRNNGVQLSEGFERKLYKSHEPGFLQPKLEHGSENGLFENSSRHSKDPSAAIHPVLTLAIDNPSELRSVFSDDSSDLEGQSSIRDRLNSLRAKFAVSQVFRAQESVGNDGSIRNQFSFTRKPVQSGSAQPTKSYITAGRSRSRRVVERFKRWIVRRKTQASRYRKRFVREANNDPQTTPLAG